MKVLLVSREDTNYSAVRFREEAQKEGHELAHLDPAGATIRLGRKPALFYRDEQVSGKGIVLPRRGAGITDHEISVLQQLKLMGWRLCNTVSSLHLARNKLRSLQLLAEAGIPIPRTMFCTTPGQVADAIEEITGPPVILKVLYGSQGKGVMLVDSVQQAQATLEAFWTIKQPILLQEFIAESRGRDLRLFVLGDQVVAAMRRQAGNLEEFRSNIHRGGKGTVIEPTAEQKEIAIRAAKVFGLEIAGVDLLESDRGPLILEVNTSPGFEGLEAATGRNIAGEVLDYLTQ